MTTDNNDNNTEQVWTMRPYHGRGFRRRYTKLHHDNGNKTREPKPDREDKK